MKNNAFKTPMVAAVILQGIAVAIGAICYFAQESFTSMQPINLGEKVFPDVLTALIIGLFMHIICLLVMQTYEGESNRAVGVIMTVVYCVVGIAPTYITMVTNIFASRQGVEYVAAKGVLTSVISLFTSPFRFVSLALALIAIGRYGVAEIERNEKGGAAE